MNSGTCGLYCISLPITNIDGSYSLNVVYCILSKSACKVAMRLEAATILRTSSSAGIRYTDSLKITVVSLIAIKSFSSLCSTSESSYSAYCAWLTFSKSSFLMADSRWKIASRISWKACDSRFSSYSLYISISASFFCVVYRMAS